MNKLLLIILFFGGKCFGQPDDPFLFFDLDRVIKWEINQNYERKGLFQNYLYNPGGTSNSLYLNGIYQSVESNGFNDVGAFSAWEKLGYKITNEIIVSIIDSGASTNNPDFSNSIIGGHEFNTSIQSGESADYSDFAGHGSRMAGIIASSHDGTNLAGICDGCKLLILKTHYNPLEIAKSIYYSQTNGAKIICLPWVIQENDSFLFNACKSFCSNGIIVCSTPNQNIDITGAAFYPCSYEIEGLIPIVNCSFTNFLWNPSAWGQNCLATFGRNILSYSLNNEIKFSTGSSESCGIASAVFAYFWGVFPNQSKESIISIVKNGCLPIDPRIIGQINMDNSIEVAGPALSLKNDTNGVVLTLAGLNEVIYTIENSADLINWQFYSDSYNTNRSFIGISEGFYRARIK